MFRIFDLLKSRARLSKVLAFNAVASEIADQ